MKKQAKRAFEILLVFGVLIFSASLTAGAAGGKPFDGSGSADGPYEISDLQALSDFCEYVNSGFGSGEYFLLTADIDMSDMQNGWTPIGNYSESLPFGGVFDGGFHTISGLCIQSDTEKYSALFGYNTGEIKNLTVSGEVAGYSYISGLCAYNAGTLQNCSVSVTVECKYRYCGAVAAYNSGGALASCTSESAVSCANNFAGGICGYNAGGSINLCSNSGSVSAQNYAGGICGQNENVNSKINMCSNSGGVICTGNYAGGVCAYNRSGAITNCLSSGTLSASGRYSGGIAGKSDSGAVSNSCSVGAVIAADKYTGGICGCSVSADISNCYYLENTAAGGINSADLSGSAATAAQGSFASGEICLLLQNAQSETGGISPVWGQQLGVQQYPCPGGAAVYYGWENCKSACRTYSNNVLYDEKPTHISAPAVRQNDIAADCTQGGSYDLVSCCEICGEEMARETVILNALGHSYSSKIIAPTCTDGGYTVYKCTLCGDEYTDDYTAAAGHTEKTVIENYVAATDTETGAYDLVSCCAVCGAQISRQSIIIPALTGGGSASDTETPVNSADETAPKETAPTTTETTEALPPPTETAATTDALPTVTQTTETPVQTTETTTEGTAPTPTEPTAEATADPETQTTAQTPAQTLPQAATQISQTQAESVPQSTAQTAAAQQTAQNTAETTADIAEKTTGENTQTESTQETESSACTAETAEKAGETQGDNGTAAGDTQQQPAESESAPQQSAVLPYSFTDESAVSKTVRQSDLSETSNESSTSPAAAEKSPATGASHNVVSVFAVFVLLFACLLFRIKLPV